MRKEDKNQLIEELAESFSTTNVLYVADTAGLDAEKTSALRRECFKQNVTLRVVKNSLLQKALDKVEGKDFSELYEALKGPTAILTAEAGNAPAKLIKSFRAKSDKPVLKGAYVEEAVYLGDNQLQALCDIKSKEELLGEIVGLLQSPARNVISALQSGGSTIAGLVKALEERAQ